MREGDRLATAVGKLLRLPAVELVSWSVEPLPRGTGRVTSALHLVRGTARAPGSATLLPWRVVVKTLRDPGATAADDDWSDPRHWTYWEREALAYQSGLLPRGEDGLRSVECLGVLAHDGGGGVDLVLSETPSDQGVRWPADVFLRTAECLGRWQARWLGVVPPVGWLSGDQLAQRLLRTDRAGGMAEPDWRDPLLGRAFPVHRRDELRKAWDRRWSLLATTASVVPTLTHGDFSRGNLSEDDDGGIVVIDWATLGHGPPGFDLAHLFLSASRELWPDAPLAQSDEMLFEAYMAGFGGDAGARATVRRAFAVTALLTGVSRLCWTLRRTTDPAVIGYWSELLHWLLTWADGELG